jgi:hypothetical protein
MSITWTTMRAWCAGALVAGALLALAFVLLAPAALSGATLAGVCAAAWILGPFTLLARAEPGEQRCAFAAGTGAGVLCGVVAAFPTPTAWFMSDVAWHVAKIARVALGHPLDDPILNEPTIYPFAFHAALALPVACGVPVVLVMKLCSVLVIAVPAARASTRSPRALRLTARRLGQRSRLPLFFYASTAGYAFLPTPFNASLGCVFLGALGLVASTRTGARGAAAWGGLALGLATLCWYGHAPWIGLAVLLWGRTRRKQLAAVLLGAVPCALVLLVHLASLRGSGDGQATAIVGAEASASLAERWAGMGRNLLTISGGFELRGRPSGSGRRWLRCCCWPRCAGAHRCGRRRRSCAGPWRACCPACSRRVCG